jgi:hypothetical protein
MRALAQYIHRAVERRGQIRYRRTAVVILRESTKRRLFSTLCSVNLAKQPLQAGEMLLIVTAQVMCQTANCEDAIAFKDRAAGALFRGQCGKDL